MRKLQNIVSNLGNILVRQGNQLVVRIESLRSLRASSQLSALYSYALQLASRLGGDAWQGPSPMACKKPRVGKAACFAAVITVVVKHNPRRHEIMCHRAAA